MEPFENDEPPEASAASLDQILDSLRGLYEGVDLGALRDEWERDE